MSEQAAKIFNALVTNDTDAAKNAFDEAIKDKVQSVMDVKRVEVAGNIYNQKESE